MARFSKRALTIIISREHIFFGIFLPNNRAPLETETLTSPGIFYDGIVYNAAELITKLQQFIRPYPLNKLSVLCLLEKRDYTIDSLCEYQWRMFCHTSGLQSMRFCSVTLGNRYDSWYEQHVRLSNEYLEQKGMWS